MRWLEMEVIVKSTSTRSSEKKVKRPRATSLPPELAELKRRRPQGQPVSPALKAYGLERIAAEDSAATVAHLLGVCPETIRLWRRPVEAPVADEEGIDTGLGVRDEKSTCIVIHEAEHGADSDPEHSAFGQVRPDLSPLSIAGMGKLISGLSPVEIEAVLALKRKHPSMQAAQIRAQLKRFKGWRLSVRAVGRVLKANGFETVHRGARPQGQEHPGSFEAPHRNALWQSDFGEFRVGETKTPLLLAEDDFSRYIVIAKLMPEPTSELVVEEIKAATRKHGPPAGIYTDRGGPFIAWGQPSSLGQYLDEQLIDHHVSAPYCPQGRGKR